MSQGFYLWSTTAASNATADPSVNYAEGQAPSTLNDSARAAMARLREYGNDISGAIVTSGTSTAYTVSSNQVFDTLPHLHGQIVAFAPHTTSGATVTLNVDGLGAKPLRSSPGQELAAGVLVQGTPYTAMYNNTDGAFYLSGFWGSSAYSIPVGSSLEYWGSTAPSTQFAFPYGQAISRTTYSGLFSLIGTTYGAGDGSTTFALPDIRGRVVACADNMGGTAASRLTSISSALGSAGGEQAHLLITAEMPSHNHSATSTDAGHTHGVSGAPYGSSSIAYQYYQAGSQGGPYGNITINTGHASITTTIANQGGDGTHNNVQPTIIANRILRIL
jgi:microcystin-dependent protein